MASPTSEGLHRWTDCFYRLGEQNRAFLETFVRGANEENLAFLRQHMEQRRQLAEHLRQKNAELFDVQRDFARQAISDCVEHAHKLSKLYWDTFEKRVEQTTRTIASVIPITRNAEAPASDRRKAA